jgi:hypothetical protein
MYLWKFRIFAWQLLSFVLLISLLAFPVGVFAYDPNTSLGSANASFIGENDYDYSAYSVAGAGDVNGDGYDDFLISAYAYDAIWDDQDEGKTYLILGDATTSWGMDFDLANAAASFIGESTGDVSGHSVAGAGDVNSDGYDDFLIGAPGNPFGGDSPGKTYLILGNATIASWGKDFNLANAHASFIGENATDCSGWSVAGAGDVNGDGYDDFLIGAFQYDAVFDSDEGKTYLILGNATISSWGKNFNLADAHASFIGEGASDWSGCSVAGAGNVNGDGYDDFIIGAPMADKAGKTYLILGNATIASWGKDFDLADAHASFAGEDDYDASGRKVAGAGDVNGDGYDDFLIGAPEDSDYGDTVGQTYLILGNATISSWGKSLNLSAAHASFIGENLGDEAGHEVAGAGDINGDGYDDLLICAPYHSNGGKYAGKTYLILGKGSGWGMDFNLFAADASFIGENAWDRSGMSVAGAGDVDGDGVDDFLIGALYNSERGTETGQTYLVLGTLPPSLPGVPGVPTLSQWGTIGMAVIFACSLVWMTKKRLLSKTAIVQ